MADRAVAGRAEDAQNHGIASSERSVGACPERDRHAGWRFVIEPADKDPLVVVRQPFLNVSGRQCAQVIASSVMSCGRPLCLGSNDRIRDCVTQNVACSPRRFDRRAVRQPTRPGGDRVEGQRQCHTCRHAYHAQQGGDREGGRIDPDGSRQWRRQWHEGSRCGTNRCGQAADRNSQDKAAVIRNSIDVITSSVTILAVALVLGIPGCHPGRAATAAALP